MKTFIYLFVVFALIKVNAQTPTLQIAQTNGSVTVSWSNAPVHSLLQATTNFSRPVFWDNMVDTLATNSFTVPATANSQQLFRVAPIIPVFQFAIFYNVNMEIDPGSTMLVKGPVFCNAGIWAGSSLLTFLSSVEAIDGINTNTADPFATNFTSLGTPTFDVPINSQADPLSLLYGNTNANLFEQMLDLPPPGLGAPNPASIEYSNQVYLYNAVDLIISNSVTGTNGHSVYSTNLTIYYENTNNFPNILTLVTNDIEITNTIAHTTNGYYSFVTNVTFYDYRESKTVQAVQIDMTKFSKWLTNTAPGGGNYWNLINSTGSTAKSAGQWIDSIYVFNNVLLTTNQLPAVRLVNGAQLPSSYGLTIATPQPLYVLGNYNVQTNSTGSVASGTNTAPTYPGALMADAITLLSGNWKDSYTVSTSLFSRQAAATTLNAATLEGIVPSNPTGSGNYSGGTENFLRLLENWNGATLTYNGSITVLFDSQYATNYWQPPGNYYAAPTRLWSFDANFLNLNKLPPLTPSLMNFVTP